jgi:alkylation response protein AidB-like acyl-CoA dehydrogenase
MDDEQIQAEVRTWLEGNWDSAPRGPKPLADAEGRSWQQRVFEAGWAAPTWPPEWYGRGFSNEQAKIIERAFAEVGAPGAGQDRTNLFANTILKFGQDALKRELLPKLLGSGPISCLLYSEPGAGSDLAGVRTRADRRGDDWLITGQKVWTSGAQAAEYALLLARTDWDAPKHRGLSFFLMPMKQPGVDVRPLHQITGDSHFNEVFLDNAVVPGANLLGKENDGWKVLQTALAYERLVMGEGAGERRQGSMRNNRLDLIGIARKQGRLNEPLIRQQIARALAYRQLNDLNIARAKAEMTQGTSSSIMSLGKLAMSRILHEDARVMTAILGSESLLDGAESPQGADANYRAFNAYMTSIGGGTDQIQRNIIAERVLGLPREIEVDRDLPFRESRAVRG